MLFLYDNVVNVYQICQMLLKAAGQVTADNKWIMFKSNQINSIFI